MSYESHGIRHVEIRNKSKNSRNDDSWTDSDSEFDKKEDELELYKRPFDKEVKSKAHINGDEKEEVKLDSLLKAVIDIEDQLQDHEHNIKKYERKYSLRNGTNDNFPLKQTQPKVAVANHEKNFKQKPVRPKTAVLKYKEPSPIGQGDFDDSDLNNTLTVAPIKKSLRKLSTDESRVELPTRVNMSFSNEQVRSIDMENQRLLKELLRTKPSKESVIWKKEPVRVRPTSAINRMKRQQEIEKDNLRFLNKLQNVKATSSLSRSSLLNEHAKHEQASSRLSRGARPSSAPSTRSTTSSRPSSGRSTKQSNYDVDSLTSVSRSSSRKSSLTGGLVDFQKIQRQQQWNEVW